MSKYVKKDRYQILTNQVIDLMEKHGSDWIKPWATHAADSHHNKFSGKAYRGTNCFFTAISAYVNGFASNEWGTYKQWSDIGCQVKKGSKGTDIVYFDKIKIEDKETREEKMIPLLKGFCVFNADQVEGYEGKKPVIGERFDSHERTENMVINSGAIVKHGGGSAFYSPSTDHIQMPNKADFNSADGYYSTLLHEMGHWTGHATRLDRKLANRFGSEAYAFEELIAETASAFMAAFLETEAEPTPNHAKYLNSWIKVLKNDKKAMMQAFSKAQKVADYLMQFDQATAMAAE